MGGFRLKKPRSVWREMSKKAIEKLAPKKSPPENNYVHTHGLDNELMILINISALCKDDPNGNVPLGKSCNRYWACQGGYPRLQRCPAMLVFDKKRKRCVSPPTEDCEVPATTPAPEDEEGGRNPSGGRRGGNPSGGRRGGSDDRGQPQPQSLPENRRRFEIEGGSPDQRGPPLGALPFDISNTGASLLSRPSQ